ncbi:NAD(P)H-binding protein [Rhodococcus sp. NPDC127528]|uniref:NAD(P)H-binding protein n=1 Tax=unclassified Rhodococcus (in: high G+C Gram-positive bacteria) TaxID=192944 RepID=UPI00363C062E
MSELIAVSGASGHLGGGVARTLSAAGTPTVLIGRDPARLPELPGATARRGSFGDPVLGEALDGVDTFVMVSATETRDRADLQRAAVDCAAAAGVRRIVYVSFVGAAPDCTFTFGRDHWHTEQRIRESGLAFTFLRDNLYLDLMPGMVGRDGVIRGPAGEGRAAMVARADVVAVAAAVVGSPDHDGETLELTGPAALSLHEVAAALTSASGRTVTYRPETLDEAYASRASYGAPQWEVDGWVSSYRAIAAGDLGRVSGDVDRVLGRPPVGITDVLRPPS